MRVLIKVYDSCLGEGDYHAVSFELTQEVLDGLNARSAVAESLLDRAPGNFISVRSHVTFDLTWHHQDELPDEVTKAFDRSEPAPWPDSMAFDGEDDVISPLDEELDIDTQGYVTFWATDSNSDVETTYHSAGCTVEELAKLLNPTPKGWESV